MKRLFQIIFILLFALTIHAQQKKFDPEKFRQEQEAYITKEAHLSPQEAKIFFPLFREMQQKQRPLFKQMRQYAKTMPRNDKEAEQLITKKDQLDMQMHKIQSTYHAKMCKSMSATKVYQCINAEESFKHHTMDKISLHKKKAPTENKGNCNKKK